MLEMKRFSSLLLRFVVDWRAQLLDKNLTFERKMLSTRRLFSNLFKMHFNSIEPFDIFLCQTQTSFSRGFGGPILFKKYWKSRHKKLPIFHKFIFWKSLSDFKKHISSETSNVWFYFSNEKLLEHFWRKNSNTKWNICKNIQMAFFMIFWSRLSKS